MSKKNVSVYKAILNEGDRNFGEILLSQDYQSPIVMNSEKTSELRFVEQNRTDGIITGILVTTQRKNIPPAHTPGDANFTAIPLDDGQGLAYPNTILFDPYDSSLYIEHNDGGLTISKIENYFIEHAKSIGDMPFDIRIVNVLRSDAYQRVQNMFSIDEIQFRIANPLGLLEHNLLSGPIRDYANASIGMNASKSLSITIKGENTNGGILSAKTNELIRDFHAVMGQTSYRAQNNKLLIKGRRYTDNQESVKEVADFMLDVIKDHIILQDKETAEDLQVQERKRGIIEIYNTHYEEVRSILHQRITRE